MSSNSSESIETLNVELSVDIGVAVGTQSERIAIFPGLDCDELKLILQSLFNLPSVESLVAFQIQPAGVVVPLSFACKNPEKFVNTTLNLVVASNQEYPNSKATSQSGADEVLVTDMVVRGQTQPPEQAPLFSINSADCLDGFDDVLREMSSGDSALLSVSEKQIIESLVAVNDGDIIAAYTQAKASGDPTVLLHALMSIARTHLSNFKPDVEEILAKLWSFREIELITNSEFLQLQVLVRTAEPVLMTAFIGFSIDGDSEKLLSRCLKAVSPLKASASETNTRVLSGEVMQFRSCLLQQACRQNLLTLIEAELIRSDIENNDGLDAIFKRFAGTQDFLQLVSELREAIDAPTIDAASEELLSKLKNDDGFSDEWLAELRTLIGTEDVATMAAFDVYGEDNNWKELVDNLDHIVVHKQNAQQLKEAEGKRTDYLLESAPPRPISTEDRRMLSNLVDDILIEKSIDQSSWESLKHCIANQNLVMDVALSLFKEDTNWEEFVDTSKRVASRCWIRPGQSEFMDFHRVLDGLVAKHRISDKAAAVIRTRLKSKEPVVAALFELYNSDRDLSELKDTLILLGQRINQS